jgi:hypothetical protein
MESWLHFVIRYSPVVFASTHVPALVFSLWRQLRKLVAHFCLPPAEILMSDEERRAAIEDEFQTWRRNLPVVYQQRITTLEQKFGDQRASLTLELKEQEALIDKQLKQVRRRKGRRGEEEEELVQQRVTLRDEFALKHTAVENELQTCRQEVEEQFSVRWLPEEQQRQSFSDDYWDEWAEDRAKDGAKLAKQFASDLEEAGFPSKMFTSNLHLVCCRWGTYVLVCCCNIVLQYFHCHFLLALAGCPSKKPCVGTHLCMVTRSRSIWWLTSRRMWASVVTWTLRRVMPTTSCLSVPCGTGSWTTRSKQARHRCVIPAVIWTTYLCSCHIYHLIHHYHHYHYHHQAGAGAGLHQEEAE